MNSLASEIIKAANMMPADAFPSRHQNAATAKTLTHQQAIEARRLHASGVWSAVALAQRYGVSARHMRQQVLA
jgi:hypothetical protein